MTAKSLACLLLCGFSACSTTEEQVVNHLEQLAANPIDSPRWQQAVDELSAIGRPAARQLIARLNPNLYQGKDYREFREEKEKLRTGCARTLGHIKPRGATGALNGCIGTDYTDNERIAALWSLGQVGYTQAGLDAAGAAPSAAMRWKIRSIATSRARKADRFGDPAGSALDPAN